MLHLIVSVPDHCLSFTLHTVQPVLNKHLRDNQKVLA